MEICKNCGLRKECKFFIKETYHCTEWKLENKDGEKFEFKRIGETEDEE